MFFIFPQAHFITIKLKMFQYFLRCYNIFSTFLGIFVNIYKMLQQFLDQHFCNQHFSECSNFKKYWFRQLFFVNIFEMLNNIFLYF
jgi:hypothetical protein